MKWVALSGALVAALFGLTPPIPAEAGGVHVGVSIGLPLPVVIPAPPVVVAPPVIVAPPPVVVTAPPVVVPAPPVAAVPSVFPFAPPALAVVPGTPVYYAPSFGPDIFFYGGHYWWFRQGAWFWGPAFRGPWTHVSGFHVPGPVAGIPVGFHRLPSGHWAPVPSGWGRGGRHWNR